MSSGDGSWHITFDETTVKAGETDHTTQSNYRTRPPHSSSPPTVTAARKTVMSTVPKTTTVTVSVSTTVTPAKKTTVTAHNFELPPVATTRASMSTVAHTVETPPIVNDFSNVLNILLPALIALIIAVSILKGTQHLSITVSGLIQSDFIDLSRQQVSGL